MWEPVLRGFARFETVITRLILYSLMTSLMRLGNNVSFCTFYSFRMATICRTLDVLPSYIPVTSDKCCYISKRRVSRIERIFRPSVCSSVSSSRIPPFSFFFFAPPLFLFAYNVVAARTVAPRICRIDLRALLENFQAEGRKRELIIMRPGMTLPVDARE
ncbi:hypothetical protein PUN28_003382 [Cardiocondyla obscurior]|uniref:Uncharacterized protein n=1 Tax=Cardiocondyla obscurior TaxID=286306 RepID=A0AAW2GKS4_9HYME